MTMKFHRVAWFWAVALLLPTTITADTKTNSALRRTQSEPQAEELPSLSTIDIDTSVFLYATPENNNVGETTNTGEIFNGDPAQETDFPNFALLCYSGSTTNCGGCGGILISSMHVLTTARCYKRIDGTELNLSGVRVGATTSRSDGIYRSVVSRVHHPQYFFDPNYNPVMFDDGLFVLRNDVAVLTLSSPIQGVKPAPYNRQQQGTTNTFDIPLTVMGFGGYKSTGTTAQQSDILRKTTMITQTDIICQAAVKDAALYVYPEHACAAGTMDTNTCAGDEGGPLVSANGVVMGLTSFGAGRCGLNFPTFYTDIWNYASWIDSQIGKATVPTPAPTVVAPLPTAEAPTCPLIIDWFFGW